MERPRANRAIHPVRTAAPKRATRRAFAFATQNTVLTDSAGWTSAPQMNRVGVFRPTIEIPFAWIVVCRSCHNARMPALRPVPLALVLAMVAAAQESISLPTDDGGRVCADLYGQGTRAVVLAHGGRFNKESWRAQANALAAEGFHVLAIDFRGFGCST